MTQRRRLAGEGAVVPGYTCMGPEVEKTTDENHCRGEQDSSLQEPPHHVLDAMIERARWRVTGLWSGRLSHSLFSQPLMIISTPRARMTMVKMVRSIETRARISTRAPKSEPTRTPSMPGKARPGTV